MEDKARRGSKREHDHNLPFSCWPPHTTIVEGAEGSGRRERDPERERSSALSFAKESRPRTVDHGGPLWELYSQSSTQPWHGKESRQERWWDPEEEDDWRCCSTKRW